MHIKHTYADVPALAMHVPMFPRAMHCLKAESLHLEEIWGGGGVCYMLLHVLHRLSPVVAQPPCVTLHPSHLCPLSCDVCLLYIKHIMYTLLYPCDDSPPASPPPRPPPDTWRLLQCPGALESMQLCLSLFSTVDFTKESQQQLLSPSTLSFSVLCCFFSANVLMCEILPPRLPSLAPSQTPRDAFCRLLWTIFKLHDFEKKKEINQSLPVLHMSWS